jgi:hypothetical protein
MKMRVVMSGLVQERTRLGDTAPIIVSAFVLPRRRPATRRGLAALAGPTAVKA